MTSNIQHSFINQNEAEALKEIIFNRVRERTEALNARIDASYTDEIKSDIMDLAQKSFATTKNPFSNIQDTSFQKQNNETNNTRSSMTFDIKEDDSPEEQVNFKLIVNDYEKTQIIENMNLAYNELHNSKNFIGALNFLNSQATDSLFRNKDNSFNALA